MPFMPEMAAYCGQRATVVKRAHKTCDGHGNLRWLDDTVHIDGLRCDGSAHGGCQAKCITYWKTSWLERVADNGWEAPARTGAARRPRRIPGAPGLDDARGYGGHGALHVPGDGSERRHQAVAVHRAEAVPLGRAVWEHSLWAFARVMTKALFSRYQRWSRVHLPPALRIRPGRGIYHVQGQETKTPKQTLDLKVGERVRVSPVPEIEATLNGHNKNRGLQFDSRWPRGADPPAQ
jgi:hypothetical protein